MKPPRLRQSLAHRLLMSSLSVLVISFPGAQAFGTLPVECYSADSSLYGICQEVKNTQQELERLRADYQQHLKELKNEIAECKEQFSGLPTVLPRSNDHAKSAPVVEEQGWPYQGVLPTDCFDSRVAYAKSQEIVRQQIPAPGNFPKEPASALYLGEGRHRLRFSTELAPQGTVQDGSRMSTPKAPEHSYVVTVRCLSGGYWIAEKIGSE